MPDQNRIRFIRFHVAVILALAATPAFLSAQNKSPVAPSSEQFAVPLLSPSQMTAADRAVAEAWQETIAASAQFFGYAVDSSYSYREIACPVAPNHLILAYEATAPNDSISRFTAVVRRGAEEEIAGKHASAEIIPILHAGVVPFVRAIANPHSIEIFNAAILPAPSATEVLAAAQKGNQPLLVRSLCYLAMVGEEPSALRSPPINQVTDRVADQATIHAPIPTVAFARRGQVRQMVSIRSSANDYQVWALNFVSGGRLISATRAEHPIDRTPLVLNAKAAAPQSLPAAAPMSAAPESAVLAPAAAPVATAEPVVSVPAPAPAASAASTVPLPAPTRPVPPTPANATVEFPQPPAASALTPTPSPASVSVTAGASSVTRPVTTPVTAPAATTTQLIAPQPPVLISTAVPSANATSSPVPQPPTRATIPVAPAPAAAALDAPPAVRPPLPPPRARFYTNLPPPPSKFIPDSALKAPPHLAQ